MPGIYSSFSEPFQISNIPSQPLPSKVLLCSPEFFEVVDVKNVHMDGNAGRINSDLAMRQWSALLDIYKSLQEKGFLSSVETIAGVKGLEDMVFCANQTFPWLNEKGERVVILSKMRHPSRQREVSWFEAFFRKRGYNILHLKQAELFEGMGDCIPHPGRKLLYGGYGHRSDTHAYEELASMLDVTVLTLELKDERFYHLDTCFIPVNDDYVFLCPDAFTPEGINLLKKCFTNLVEIPAEEAVSAFALNAHILRHPVSGKFAAILQPGAEHMKRELKHLGAEIYETETGEFMESGGSVFCMKMMYY